MRLNLKNLSCHWLTNTGLLSSSILNALLIYWWHFIIKFTKTLSISVVTSLLSIIHSHTHHILISVHSLHSFSSFVIIKILTFQRLLSTFCHFLESLLAHDFGWGLVELTWVVVGGCHRCILVALANIESDHGRWSWSFTRWIVTKLSLMLVIVGVSLASLMVMIVVMINFIRALMAVILRLFNGGQLIAVNVCCGLILVVWSRIPLGSVVGKAFAVSVRRRMLRGLVPELLDRCAIAATWGRTGAVAEAPTHNVAHIGVLTPIAKTSCRARLAFLETLTVIFETSGSFAMTASRGCQTAPVVRRRWRKVNFGLD